MTTSLINFIRTQVGDIDSNPILTDAETQDLIWVFSYQDSDNNWKVNKWDCCIEYTNIAHARTGFNPTRVRLFQQRRKGAGWRPIVDSTAPGSIIPPGGIQQVQSDWAETDATQPDFIKNKPTLAPSDAERNVQSDWNETDSNDDAFIKNKPNISQVTQVQSDWNETDSSQPDFIKNKPNIPTQQAARALSSQAQAEAGTDNTTVMTPERVWEAIKYFAEGHENDFWGTYQTSNVFWTNTSFNRERGFAISTSSTGGSSYALANIPTAATTAYLFISNKVQNSASIDFSNLEDIPTISVGSILYITDPSAADQRTNYIKFTVSAVNSAIDTGGIRELRPFTGAVQRFGTLPNPDTWQFSFKEPSDIEQILYAEGLRGQLPSRLFAANSIPSKAFRGSDFNNGLEKQSDGKIGIENNSDVMRVSTNLNATNNVWVQEYGSNSNIDGVPAIPSNAKNTLLGQEADYFVVTSGNNDSLTTGTAYAKASDIAAGARTLKISSRYQSIVTGDDDTIATADYPANADVMQLWNASHQDEGYIQFTVTHTPAVSTGVGWDVPVARVNVLFKNADGTARSTNPISPQATSLEWRTVARKTLGGQISIIEVSHLSAALDRKRDVGNVPPNELNYRGTPVDGEYVKRLSATEFETSPAPPGTGLIPRWVGEQTNTTPGHTNAWQIPTTANAAVIPGLSITAAGNRTTKYIVRAYINTFDAGGTIGSSNAIDISTKLQKSIDGGSTWTDLEEGRMRLVSVGEDATRTLLAEDTPGVAAPQYRVIASASSSTTSLHAVAWRCWMEAESNQIQGVAVQPTVGGPPKYKKSFNSSSFLNSNWTAWRDIPNTGITIPANNTIEDLMITITAKCGWVDGTWTDAASVTTNGFNFRVQKSTDNGTTWTTPSGFQINNYFYGKYIADVRATLTLYDESVGSTGTDGIQYKLQAQRHNNTIQWGLIDCGLRAIEVKEFAAGTPT